MNLLNELQQILKQDDRFVSETGDLIKASISLAASQVDASFISLLLSSPLLKERFFMEVGEVLVFDKSQFNWVVNNKEFLPDSYTAYKNKVGFSTNDYDLLSESGEITLVWPYKDTVLEGGQTKEDQERNEVFYNETLAPEQVRKLLAPKALTNGKRYTELGEEEVGNITDNDNLIIKGNNLLALSSILESYRGKVKAIFIDPPYYFVNHKPADTFSYNSNFKLSSWLVFMKNRLELAKELLSDKGILYMTISSEGAHYLKVMADEVFGMENFIADITWQSRKSVSSDGLISVSSNHVLTYAKNIKEINKNKFRFELDVDGFSLDDNDGRGKYKVEPFDAPNVRKNLEYPITNPNTGEVYYPPVGRHWRTMESEYLKMLEEGRIRFGAKGTARPQLKVFLREAKEQSKGKAPTTLWDEVTPDSIVWSETGTTTNGTQHQQQLFGKVVFENPKPEDLVSRALQLSTDANDLVLDFFMGSATTQAVAHKMNRRYIGIEQMEETMKNVAIPRLLKVIEGEQGGISKELEWQGGGSFVYLELKERSQTLVRKLEESTTSDEFLSVYEEAKEYGWLVATVEVEKFEDLESFYKLSADEQRNIVLKAIDKNKLYLNASEVDDSELALKDEEKELTRMFYAKEGESNVEQRTLPL